MKQGIKKRVEALERTSAPSAVDGLRCHCCVHWPEDDLEDAFVCYDIETGERVDLPQDEARRIFEQDRDAVEIVVDWTYGPQGGDRDT